MNKEMFISSSPHETKVAVCEDGQLVEVYFERDTDVGLVGGIYKGRVNRVLPGMQSAFVDIGLERDAFLYVADFSLQDQDEFEGILDESKARPAAIEVEPRSAPAETGTSARPEFPEAPGRAGTSIDVSEPEAQEEESPAVTTVPEPVASEASRGGQTAPGAETPGDGRDFHRRSHRGRRRRGRHGRGGFDRRHERHAEPQAAPPKPEPAAEPEDFEILPGESLAKYRHSSIEDFPATETAASARDEDATPAPVAVPEAEEPEAPEQEIADRWDLQAEEFLADVKTESQEGIGEPVRKLPIEIPESLAGPADEFEEATESTFEPEPEGEEETAETDEILSAEFEDEPGVEGTAAEEDTETTEEGSEAEEQAVEAAEGTTEPESSERSYTLREPHSRPHFAPRRGRRGRRRSSRNSRRNGGRERESARTGSQQGLQISELLKEGQEIIVQIAKEPLGTKGARITSHVALPGRYVVYMPTITHIGVSRKIASEQERLRLRNIVLEHRGSLTGGFIVRTAGEGHSDEEIKADLRFLTNLWNDIRTRAEQAKAPALLYRDLDLAQRLMRDLVTPDFKSIWLDNEADYERVVEFINRLQPSLVGCAKLHTRLTSLFEEHGIEDEIAKALKPKVWLKSGGYIVINQTEALVAIDVNTGKYVGKTNRLEDTIVKTNIDAVNEIVRQIRLRDLGGIIVIDFIDMDERRNRNKVVQALEEALRRDRAPTKVLSFNDFGLVAVTRKRVKQSLERTLCDPCAYCNGSGWVKSVSTVAYEIMAEARKMAEEIEGKTMTLRVNPEVAQELKSKDGSLIREIEALTHKNLVIKSDPTIHQERFEIF